MHYQPDIHTISKSAPPSYAEAMAQTATKDNSYISPYGQPTITTTTCDQNCSQIPGYPSSANNFYTNISGQPSYNPFHVSMESSQQYRHTTTPTIVHVETIGTRQPKTCKFPRNFLDIDRYFTLPRVVF